MSVARPVAVQRLAVLSGGIGGVKLVEGLRELLPADAMTVICNTGDDLEMWGLHISPDVDTVLYTLSGLVNRDQGWGVDSDSYQALEMLQRYGEPGWFLLGDRDIGTHLLRSKMLREGRRMSEVTQELAQRLGIASRVLPATDDSVRTFVLTPDGEMDFQTYFVRRRFEPPVEEVRYRGADDALPSPEAAAAVLSANTVVIAPSNPVASIGPMLAVRGFREALAQARGLRVAVSPLIGGEAVKGPTVQMMEATNFPATPIGVAQAYEGLIDALVIDRQDVAYKPELEEFGLSVLATDTLMEGFEGRLRLAAEVLDFCAAMARRRAIG
ncbi:MAG TPA: 2-phospho-L-lactate transferase [Candidatus Dormibacteraeota bacterium]|jgi:LPPG:FO 2-phospho-L-lactate transferase